MSVSTRVPEALDWGWLHDDREEDLVGADWHQNAIRGLVFALRTLAEERGWPWHVGDQLTLVGPKPDGTLWRPAPDISVHPALGPAEREELDVRAEGPPALVIEVASRTTWRYDSSLERVRRGRDTRVRQAGKAYGYLWVLEVPEYLVFDPHGEYLGVACRGWRHLGDRVEAWAPEPDGRYQSRELGIALRPDGSLLRVLDPQGRPVPHWFEKAREAATLRAQSAAQAERIAALEAELDALRRRGE